MLISLSALVCEVGPIGSSADWWAMAEAIAEGAVRANMAWLRRRNLEAFAFDKLRLRYSPRPALLLGEGLAQGIRLAPALVHERTGSCIDLACYYAALLRLRGRADARVSFRVDRVSACGHALVTGEGFELDPTIRLLGAGASSNQES